MPEIPKTYYITFEDWNSFPESTREYFEKAKKENRIRILEKDLLWVKFEMTAATEVSKKLT